MELEPGQIAIAIALYWLAALVTYRLWKHPDQPLIVFAPQPKQHDGDVDATTNTEATWERIGELPGEEDGSPPLLCFSQPQVQRLDYEALFGEMELVKHQVNSMKEDITEITRDYTTCLDPNWGELAMIKERLALVQSDVGQLMNEYTSHLDHHELMGLTAGGKMMKDSIRAAMKKSSCRDCGEPGHWSPDCPQRKCRPPKPSRSPPPSTTPTMPPAVFNISMDDTFTSQMEEPKEDKLGDTQEYDVLDTVSSLGEFPETGDYPPTEDESPTPKAEKETPASSVVSAATSKCPSPRMMASPTLTPPRSPREPGGTLASPRGSSPEPAIEKAWKDDKVVCTFSDAMELQGTVFPLLPVREVDDSEDSAAPGQGAAPQEALSAQECGSLILEEYVPAEDDKEAISQHHALLEQLRVELGKSFEEAEAQKLKEVQDDPLIKSVDRFSLEELRRRVSLESSNDGRQCAVCLRFRNCCQCVGGPSTVKDLEDKATLLEEEKSKHEKTQKRMQSEKDDLLLQLAAMEDRLMKEQRLRAGQSHAELMEQATKVAKDMIKEQLATNYPKPPPPCLLAQIGRSDSATSPMKPKPRCPSPPRTNQSPPVAKALPAKTPPPPPPPPSSKAQGWENWTGSNTTREASQSSSSSSSGAPLPTFGGRSSTSEVTNDNVGGPDLSGRAAAVPTPLTLGRPRQSPIDWTASGQDPRLSTSAATTAQDLPAHPNPAVVNESPIWLPGMVECPHHNVGHYSNQHGGGWRCEDCATKWYKALNGDQRTTSGPRRYRRPPVALRQAYG